MSIHGDRPGSSPDDHLWYASIVRSGPGRSGFFMFSRMPAVTPFMPSINRTRAAISASRTAILVAWSLHGGRRGIQITSCTRIDAPAPQCEQVPAV